MSPAIVLDAGAFDVLDTSTGTALRALLRRAAERGSETKSPAVVLAEVCRGAARTRRVEAALARDRDGQRIRIVPTDERLAKLVGAVLYAAGRGSEALADAHVVAVCAASDAAVVVSSDPDDIAALAPGVPGVRIIVRRPTDI
jgi:predicted nucleic acid-binding protein